MVFMVVSTPRQPTTVVMPALTISLRWIGGVCVLKPSSPLPPSRCSCGSMRPGVTRQPVASMTWYSTPSRSNASRETTPIFAIRSAVIRTDAGPAGSGVYSSPCSISVNMLECSLPGCGGFRLVFGQLGGGTGRELGGPALAEVELVALTQHVEAHVENRQVVVRLLLRDVGRRDGRAVHDVDGAVAQDVEVRAPLGDDRRVL